MLLLLQEQHCLLFFTLFFIIFYLISRKVLFHLENVVTCFKIMFIDIFLIIIFFVFTLGTIQIAFL
jgi:hypothetical protein